MLSFEVHGTLCYWGRALCYHFVSWSDVDAVKGALLPLALRRGQESAGDPPGEDPAENLAELGVVDGVDDRVEGGVGIAVVIGVQLFYYAITLVCIRRGRR